MVKLQREEWIGDEEATCVLSTYVFYLLFPRRLNSIFPRDHNSRAFDSCSRSLRCLLFIFHFPFFRFIAAIPPSPSSAAANPFIHPSYVTQRQQSIVPIF